MSVVVTRFILSLRSVDLPKSNVPGESSIGAPSTFTSRLHFASQARSIDLVGNIGAPLNDFEADECVVVDPCVESAGYEPEEM